MSSLNHPAAEKILALDELARVAARQRARGRKIVLCHGVFDLLHPGHVRHFEAAKKHGDILVVTLTEDRHVNKGPGRPYFSQDQRALSVAALGVVDYVAVNPSATAENVLALVRPHVYAKGPDYADPKKDITGGIAREARAAKKVGAVLVVTEEPVMSSSHLLNHHFSVYPPEARSFLDRFGARYPVDDILKSISALRHLKVLVVGEAIIDEYHYCQAMGKSPKETIVSTRYVEEEAFAGGALAAANHMAGFVSDVHLVSCLGTVESRESFVRKALKPEVTPKFFFREGSRSIIKRRFVDPAFLTKMFEVSYLDDQFLDEKLEKKVASYLERVLPRYDLVLVTDYGHGLIGPGLVKVLCRKSPFLAVNTQANSANHGYNVITKYPHADYICIDEPELRLAQRDRFGDIKRLLLDSCRGLRSKRMVVTRGHRGALAYEHGKGFTEIPVFSSKIVDRTGAGDAYLALSALCVAGGLPMELAAFVGNAAGALHVGTVCNRTPIEAVPLFKFLTAMLR